MGGSFRANVFGIDCFLDTVNDMIVDPVFDEASDILNSKHPSSIRLVFGKEKFRRAFTMKPASIGLSLVHWRKVQFDDGIGRGTRLAQPRASGTISPRPRIAEPNRGQNPKIGRFRATIGDRDLDQNVIDIGLGIFHEHVEVAIFVEYTGIEQFEFGLALVALSIFLY